MASEEEIMKYVKCTKCGAESQPGKFCTECGEPLDTKSQLIDAFKEPVGQEIYDAVDKLSARLVQGGDTTDTVERIKKINAEDDTPKLDSSTAPEETEEPESQQRLLYTGHIIDRADIIDGYCSMCKKPIFGKSPKYCPHQGCNASFLKEEEPVLRIYGVQIETLVINQIKDIYLRVENCGDNDVHGITIECKSMHFDKLAESDLVGEIVPGNYSLVPINLLFKNDGKPKCEIKIIYHDENRNEYTIEKSIHLTVHERTNPDLDNKLKSKAENQIVIKIENFVSGDLKKGNFTEIVDSVINRSTIGTDNVAIDDERTIGDDTLKAPETPNGFKVFVSGNSVVLQWESSARAQKYRIERSDGKPFKWHLLDEITDCRYVDNEVTGGTGYFYRVVATGAGGSSTPTVEAGAEIGVHYEVDAQLELQCGFHHKKFRLICAPGMRLGRGRRENNLQNHLVISDSTYISRKQLLILKSGSFFDLNQGDSRPRIFKNGDKIDLRFNLTGPGKLRIKTNKNSDFKNIECSPLFSDGDSLGLVVDFEDETIIFIQRDIVIKWNPGKPDDFTAENPADDDTNVNELQVVDVDNVFQLNSGKLRVNNLLFRKINESPERDKWGDPMYEIVDLCNKTSHHKSDPDKTIDSTIVDDGSELKFAVLYDSSKSGFVIKPL